MTKKLTQIHPSLKIKIKKQPPPTQQFNSLIKVLKPKVFITNSSNFKTLVQELTGNGSHSPEPPHVIHIDGHNDNPDPSIGCSSDQGLDCSPDQSLGYSPDQGLYCSPDQSLGYSFDKGLYCSPDQSLGCSPDPNLDTMFLPFDYSSCSSEELGLEWPQDPVMDYVNEMELRNLESWLLDFDSSTCIHDAPFVPMNTFEYEYDLPSIIM